jgi:hypothetical protein
MTPEQRHLGEFGLAVYKNRRAISAEVNYIMPMKIDWNRQIISEGPGVDVTFISEFEQRKPR